MWGDLEFFHLYGWINEVKKVIEDYKSGVISTNQFDLIMQYKRKELQEYEEEIRSQKGTKGKGLQE